MQETTPSDTSGLEAPAKSQSALQSSRTHRRNQEESAFAALGHQVARSQAMFDYSYDILLVGLHKDDDEYDATEAEHETELERKLDWMLEQCPVLAQALHGLSEYPPADRFQCLRSITHVIDTGRCEARNDDTRAVKLALMYDFYLDAPDHHLWPPFDPTLKGLKKSEWGFRHPELAKLCTPFGKDPEDESVLQSFRIAGGEPGPEAWPLVLYDETEIGNADNKKLDGLLRGKALILMYKHVLLGSATADAQSTVALQRHYSYTGSRKVTLPSLVYIATLASLRFGVSSEPHFDSGFQNDTFYSQMLETLSEPQEKDSITDLLAFWNSTIFGSPDGEAEPLLAPDSSWDAMIRRRAERAKWAQLERATPDGDTALPESEQAPAPLSPLPPAAASTRTMEPPEDDAQLNGHSLPPSPARIQHATLEDVSNKTAPDRTNSRASKKRRVPESDDDDNNGVVQNEAESDEEEEAPTPRCRGRPPSTKKMNEPKKSTLSKRGVQVPKEVPADMEEEEAPVATKPKAKKRKRGRR